MRNAPRTWRPNLSAARRDDAALARHTRGAIRALVDAVKPEQVPVFDDVVKTFERISGGYGSALCYPEVNDWYFHLVQTFESERKIELSDFRQRLEMAAKAIRYSQARAHRNKMKVGAHIDLSAGDAWVDAALRRGESFVGALSKKPVHLEAFSELPADVLGRLENAFQVLYHVWPEAYAEMPWFVRRLIVYKGHAIIGFTDFRFHGSVFFKYERMMKRPTVAGVAEDLVHEAAHVRLNAIMGAQPLFTNDNTPLYRTPLRNDLRPMYGVFHQMYVLTRLTEFYSRILDHTGYKCQSALRSSFDGACHAYATVVAHAELTRVGQRLVGTIGRRLKQTS